MSRSIPVSLAEQLGLEPTDVIEIRVKPEYIEADVTVKDPDGKILLNHQNGNVYIRCDYEHFTSDGVPYTHVRWDQKYGCYMAGHPDITDKYASNDAETAFKKLLNAHPELDK